MHGVRTNSVSRKISHKVTSLLRLGMESECIDTHAFNGLIVETCCLVRKDGFRKGTPLSESSPWNGWGTLVSFNGYPIGRKD